MTFTSYILTNGHQIKMSFFLTVPKINFYLILGVIYFKILFPISSLAKFNHPSPSSGTSPSNIGPKINYYFLN